jgi:hypothetical protein
LSQNLFALTSYAGELVDLIRQHFSFVLEIIKGSEDQRGFQVQPKRWIVERTFGWINSFLRLSKDYENTIESSEGTTISRFRGDKVRGLLAYLAVEADRPHARATLAALFWPEQPDALALGNLSQALTRLRAALGPDAAIHLRATHDSLH